MDNLDEPLYAKINQDVRKRADTYVYESKMLGKENTDSLKKLIEVALDDYIAKTPILQNRP